MVSIHNELTRAQRLMDDFNRKKDDFDGITSLSEALGIISDVLSSADDDQVRKVANNLVKTCKRSLIPRITHAVSSPKEVSFEQLAYLDKVCDEFASNNFDDAQEFRTFQVELKRHKESAEGQIILHKWAASIRKLPSKKRKALIESLIRDINDMKALEAFKLELEAQDV